MTHCNLLDMQAPYAATVVRCAAVSTMRFGFLRPFWRRLPPVQDDHVVLVCYNRKHRAIQLALQARFVIPFNLLDGDPIGDGIKL